MKFKELAARLLNDKPQSWPKQYQELGSSPELPQNIDDKIKLAIQNAVAESKNESTHVVALKNDRNQMNRYRIWATAATMVLVSGIGLYTYLNQTRENKNSGLISIVVGTAELNENFTNTPKTQTTRQLNPADLSESGIAFVAGSRLQTHADSAAQILFSDSIKIRIGPESEYILLPNQASDHKQSAQQNNHFDSKLSGEMYYESGKLPKDTKFIVHTPTAVTTVHGTIYNIEASPNLTTLVVYEGRVEVAAIAKENRAVIKEGQKALIDANGDIVVSDYTIGDKARQSQFKRSDEAFKKYGTGPLDDDLELDTVSAIKKKYGSLYQVILKDGRQYQGFPSLHNQLLQVHTTYGVIEIDQSDVKSLIELK